MSLAEKYLDFQMLIKICEKTQNQTRLDEYMEKFKEYVIYYMSNHILLNYRN